MNLIIGLDEAIDLAIGKTILIRTDIAIYFFELSL